MKSPAYPVKEFSYLELEAFEDQVASSNEKIIVIFSDGTCLWSSIPKRSCFVFERKLDSYVKQFKELGWKIVGIDVGFRYPELMNRYGIRLRPTAMVFDKGISISKIEPNVIPRTEVTLFFWQDSMIKEMISATKNI